MPTIRYMRNLDGACKMFDDGYCWAEAFLWQYLGEDHVRNGLKKHPHLKARNFVYTIDEVAKQHQCGYCGACMPDSQTLEEKANGI